MSDSDEQPGAGVDLDQMRDDVLRHGGWTVFPYRPGEDEAWDRLGEDWHAVQGMTPESVRLYARWGDSEDGRSTQLTGLCMVGDAVTASLVRSIPVGRLELLNRRKGGLPTELIKNQLAPLRRKRDTDPERFAEQVAHYYGVFAQMSSKPVKELAEHSGVPVPTVRSWIREARLRGKLPPGTRGKAG